MKLLLPTADHWIHSAAGPYRSSEYASFVLEFDIVSVTLSYVFHLTSYGGNMFGLFLFVLVSKSHPDNCFDTQLSISKNQIFVL